VAVFRPRFCELSCRTESSEPSAPSLPTRPFLKSLPTFYLIFTTFETLIKTLQAKLAPNSFPCIRLQPPKKT
jgi:hypothetical protein